jgi:hypothetical protein
LRLSLVFTGWRWGFVEKKDVNNNPLNS